MPGGHTLFGTRVFGSHAPVIDPGTLGPALYLSGLPNDGLAQSGGVLTHWTDKVLGKVFNPTGGSAGVTVFNDGSTGEAAGIWSVSICGGNFFRGFDAQGTLPGFSNANGYTQFLLTGGINSNPYGVRGFFWPSGANGLGLIEQGPGFSFFGGVPSGNLAVQDGAAGFDTGISTPLNQTSWSLWTLVSDGASNTTLYRNGVLGPKINTGVVGLSTQLVFGGPSAGPTFVCVFVSAYLLYTTQLTPVQIAGTYRWFKGHYGI